ncbi:YqiJ family protein [Shewanella sp. GXUN23E]|uniref:YqiJ family protein n=1 Tax=Shewanella sp. GXUN23E TaxID=3422498 RepID=UPI003D7C9569
MLDFFFMTANLPFAVAISMVVLLGCIELLSLLTGWGFSNLFDDFFGADVEVDTDVTGGFTGLVGWLCLNRLPLLVWLVMALTLFAIAGFTLNYLTALFLEALFSEWLTIVFALLMAALGCRLLGPGLAAVLPKNETSAVSIDSLAGCVGVVTLATASPGKPAEVMVRDASLQKHYVLVEPELAEEFTRGTQVVLLRKQGNRWLAARLEPHLFE